MSKKYFESINTGVRFPEVEKNILDFWKKEDIFKKSMEKTKDGKPFVFYDGPPFATGLPHYGHLLAGTLKDIVPRYWTMRGRYVQRRFGWDCHGLPVENEMEKEFNVSGKKDIETLGIDLFNEACRSIVLRYTSQWEDVVLRMGRWVDFENQYRTMDPSYMESIWWVFKKIWEKNLIYKGFSVQPYCPRCTTPLSNFEVNEGYKDVKSPSITVTFPLADDPSVKILVWTTTPWTLPSNLVLATGADIDYVKIKDGNDFFIIAKERLSAYYKSKDDYEIIETMKGTALEGLRYTPMFEYFKDSNKKLFQVTTADYVSTEDGTGIVHIAPAFGEDDFKVGATLDLPIICPVDAEGKFTEEVKDWSGEYIFDADDSIIRRIKEMGRLVHKTKIEHRYPHCYRCDTPLLYKTIDAYFVKVDPLKENMLENNKKIHWVPEHLKEGRFGKLIEGSPDWNISRNRYWGTPIPLWECECGHVECVGSLDDLHTLVGNGVREEGRKKHSEIAEKVSQTIKESASERFRNTGVDDKWSRSVEGTTIESVDLHRHIVDELPLVCPKCKKHMTRTPEVLDCWFESGSMPYAQRHYPFENKKVFEGSFPADFIAEGLDQTRGWFNKLTVIASALFNKAAFKNVIVNGIILAEDGKKLSKRLKNYAPPQEILDSLGADALRLFLINSPAVKAEDLRFSETGVMEMARAVLIPFWNAYSFFVTYANVDNWKPEANKKPESNNELDKWIISLLNHLVDSVNNEMENYNLYKVVPLMVDYIDNLTNWYIRRSRRRFWKSENDNDKNSAYETLYHVLVEFSKTMAPFLPFLTEAVYRNLAVKPQENLVPQSVHLCNFPISDKTLIDKDLETRMSLVRDVVGMGRILRSRFNIKNRQPLSELSVVIRDNQKRKLVSKMSVLIKEELNIKNVIFSSNEDSLVDISAKPNFRTLGRVFGKEMRTATEVIENFTLEDIRSLENGETKKVLDKEIKFEDIELRRTEKQGIQVETRGEITVALNTEISVELKSEGDARELINRIQNIRKQSNFNVVDRINVTIDSSETLKTSIKKYLDFVKAETLADTIEWASLDSGENTDINGEPIKFSVTVVK